MAIIYNIIISLYYLAICIASLFNKKAKLFLKGRKDIFKKIESAVTSEDNIVWFHAASLGEFEQGRPVIEAFKNKFPQYKILLTFFSPSGYEIRKNYQGADFIFYLPFDFRGNVKKFIKLVNPKCVFFIKYEYWYNYLSHLKRKDIPVYLFSALFRNDQLFFKWYGGFYRKILKIFKHIFVQNESSFSLLKSYDFKDITVCGDTRFDRVFEIAMNAGEIPVIREFCKDNFVIVAGSTWEPDEQLISVYFKEKSDKKNIRLIIAPHEIHKEHITKTCALFSDSICYSEANSGNLSGKQVLIIDNIGMLSSLYKYGKIAYIGGGFGKGIHNTLEAVTHGLPVIFGPNYHKFQEAKDLISLNTAVSIQNKKELISAIEKFRSNPEYLQQASASAKKYINDGRGATDILISFLEKTNLSQAGLN